MNVALKKMQKTNRCDALVIGCGFSGSVVARFLAEHGKQVQIWERRNHIAGNMYDYVDEHNILVQKYGPHTFHTVKKDLYKYICQFAEWEEFQLCCGAEIQGICTPTPFNFHSIDHFYSNVEAENLKQHIKSAYGDKKTASVLEALKHSDPLIRNYAKFLFDNDYRPYTAKQWGIEPNEIDPSVLQRVPLRFSYDKGYFEDEFQVMPKEGYTKFFHRLLDHANIQICLGIEALKRLKVNESGDKLFVDDKLVNFPVIYTGALDELFQCCYGHLPYRSLKFEWRYEEIESKQDLPVVAYPKAKEYTRIVEYKKLPVQNTHGTTYVIEFPLQYQPERKTEPYYPVLTKKSMALYQKYAALADRVKNLFYCGRLADFKYYNMDQALEHALLLCEKIPF